MPKIQSRQHPLLYSLPVKKKWGFFHLHMIQSLLQWCHQASSVYTSIQISNGYYSVICHKSSFSEQRVHISSHHIRSRLDSKAQHSEPPAVSNKKLANSFSDNSDVSQGHGILLLCHPIEGLLSDKQETEFFTPIPPPIPIDISKRPGIFSWKLAENTSLVTVDHIVTDC